MNNLLKIAGNIPANDEVPVISVSPVTLRAPDRGMDLEVRISAPVTGTNLPVILLSHGHAHCLVAANRGRGPLRLSTAYSCSGYSCVEPCNTGPSLLATDPL